jgi:hypothetical protein
MEKELINNVCKKIYEQFPLVEGIIPEVKPQPNDIQLLVFQSSGKISNQKTIPINIRVVINKMGDILKITSSR